MDCLRHSEPPKGIDETLASKRIREAANWDSDCAFEAAYDENAKNAEDRFMPTWWKDFKEIYGMKNTYDVDGNPVSLPEVDHGD